MCGSGGVTAPDMLRCAKVPVAPQKETMRQERMRYACCLFARSTSSVSAGNSRCITRKQRKTHPRIAEADECRRSGYRNSRIGGRYASQETRHTHIAPQKGAYNPRYDGTPCRCTRAAPRRKIQQLVAVPVASHPASHDKAAKQGKPPWGGGQAGTAKAGYGMEEVILQYVGVEHEWQTVVGN